MGMTIDPQKLFSIRTRLDRPLTLIGMMGAGKSRLGRMLSEALDLPFADSDEEIEKAAGLNIPEIFAKFGEPYFRDGEARVIKRLLDEGTMIVATGGGAILNPETASDLFDRTVCIWVKADIEVMLERTGKNDKRPLLKNGNPREILTNLAEVRYPIYSRAHITVESHNGPAEGILATAIDQIAEYLTHSQLRAGT